MLGCNRSRHTIHYFQFIRVEKAMSYLTEAFLSMEEFRAQTDWLVLACLDGEKRSGVDETMVPGQREMIRRYEALQSGLSLYPGVAKSLSKLAGRYGLMMPAPIDSK
jgi:LDH2 family malate/lactate/ureidoglycolate dehydrogenase